jgi:hypothetical protein
VKLQLTGPLRRSGGERVDLRLSNVVDAQGCGNSWPGPASDCCSVQGPTLGPCGPG